MYFYQRLKDLRDDKDMTQQQVAEIIGTYQTHYSKYERGEREIPFHLVIKLAKFYDVSIDYIAGLTNNPRPIQNNQNEKEKYTIKQENNINAIGIINIKRKGKKED